MNHPRSLATSTFSRRAIIAAWLALAVLLLPPSLKGSPQQIPSPVVFTGVNVLPMDDEVILENHTVIVRGERIEALAPDGQIAVPPDATVIVGAGRYLMPGLTEMHAHIPGPPERAERFPGPHDPQGVEDVLFLFVANGVTTARGMIGDPYHLELRQRVAVGEVLGPTLYTAGMGLFHQNVPDPEAAERVVREQHAAGYDFLKVFSITPEAYARMAATAHELGIPFAGHIPAEVGLEGALKHRQLTIDHLDRYAEFLVREDADIGDREAGFFGSGLVDLIDPERIPLAAERTREAGVWNVPTQTLLDNLASAESAADMAAWPEMRYLPEDMVATWVDYKDNLQAQPYFQPEAAQRLVEIRRELIRALHDGGAMLALGSDAPQFFNVPGFSVHGELASLVASGLTPFEALVTGTRNAATVLGAPGEFGTIGAGRRADLVLLDDNPLLDIANTRRIAGVMVRGQWLAATDIEQRLEAIAARHARD